MTDQYQSQDNSSLHKYRTEIPNIIFDLGLDPFAMALYLHYKKVAGDHGKCFQRKSTISESTGMSPSTIKDRNKELTKPRDELNGKALITITQRQDENGEALPTLVEINDIWPENFQKLSSRFSGDGGGSSKNGGGSLNGGKQEEPFKKNQKQQQQPPPPTQVFACLLPLDIPEEEKEWITRNHTEEHVKHAVKYVTSPGTEIKSSLIQALKWACKTQPKIKKTATATEQENKQLLETLRPIDGKISGKYRMDVGTKDIQFIYTEANCKPIIFSIESKSFKNDVYEFAKKNGFVSEKG